MSSLYTPKVGTTIKMKKKKERSVIGSSRFGIISSCTLNTCMHVHGFMFKNVDKLAFCPRLLEGHFVVFVKIDAESNKKR